MNRLRLRYKWEDKSITCYNIADFYILFRYLKDYMIMQEYGPNLLYKKCDINYIHFETNIDLSKFI